MVTTLDESKQNLNSSSGLTHLVSFNARDVARTDKADWDVFIAHASEDKDSFVSAFVEKLHKMGLNVWYDDFELRWGSKLMKSINRGLQNSKYGIVVLSNNFFGKPWPEAELSALFNMMISSEKDTLLPLRHGISHKELTEKAPLLADIINRSTDTGIDALAQEFYEIVKGNHAMTKTIDRRTLTEGPIVQIVNFGIEPPASPEAKSARYHPNLRNDGSISVSNIRMYYKIMDGVVALDEIIKLKKEIKTHVILYEGSIIPNGSARVDSVDLPRKENEISAIFWIEYDFGNNETSQIIFDVRFQNFRHTKTVTYVHSIVAKAEKTSLVSDVVIDDQEVADFHLNLLFALSDAQIALSDIQDHYVDPQLSQLVYDLGSGAEQIFSLTAQPVLKRAYLDANELKQVAKELKGMEKYEFYLGKESWDTFSAKGEAILPRINRIIEIIRKRMMVNASSKKEYAKMVETAINELRNNWELAQDYQFGNELEELRDSFKRYGYRFRKMGNMHEADEIDDIRPKLLELSSKLRFLSSVTGWGISSIGFSHIEHVKSNMENCLKIADEILLALERN